MTSTIPAGAAFGIVTNSGTSQFGGPLATGDITFSTNQGIVLGLAGTAANIQTAGNVALDAGASVTQDGGSILANGLKLTGSGAFNLNQSGNDVATLAANITGASSALTYRDANALAVGTVLGTSGITVTGPVSLTAGGAITQTAPLTVGGASSFSAGANPITLTNAGNDFTGAVSLNNSGANNVAVTDANAIVLGASNVGTGTLTVISSGAIAQTGALTQAAGAGLVSIRAGTSDITLTNAGNDFTGLVATDTTGNVTITDANSFIINGGGVSGGTTASFTLNANGTVSQSSAFTSAPTVVVINAGIGPIVLNNPGNDFTGNVSVAATTTGAASFVNTNAAGINFAASTVGGALSLTSGGPVTQTGAVTVGGTSTINAGANPITLTNSGNDFTGAVSLNNSGANNVAVTDSNAITVGASSVGTGDLNVTSSGSLTQSGAINAGGNIRLDAQGAGANVAIAANINKISGADATLEVRAAGDITLSGGADITSSSNKLNVVLNSNRDAVGTGRIQLGSDTAITSNGGNVTLGGGVDPLSNPAVGAGGAGTPYGVWIDGASIDAGTGNVSIRGLANGSAGNDAHGVVVIGGSSIVASGNISISGQGGIDVTANRHSGVIISESTITETGSGTLAITGTGGTGGADGSRGVEIVSSSVIQSAGSGGINITGTGGSGGSGSQGVMVSNATVQSTGAGNIDIQGTGGDGFSGVNFGFLATNGAIVQSLGNGSISIRGTGGSSPSDWDGGILVEGVGATSRVSSVDGAITLIGTGGDRKSVV